MARIEDLPLATPVYNDIDLFADISDSNNAKSNTIGSKVKAGLADPTVTADDLQDWATKKVLTAIERTKLAGIQAGAQVNTVTSVNWQMGIVVLDADDIADTATRKMGNEIFDTSEKNKLDTAYTHSQAVTGNPHNVTAAQVWLGNVANERQLSRTAGNFNALPLKTDIQRNMNDLVPIQDAFDNDIIKKVTVGTQYIRYSSTIQLWRPSVNYHADTLVNSTTYEIRNIVIDEVTGGMYYCTISHQSGANFASDLALWYWTPVLAWGGGSSPVYVIRWASNPTQAIPWWPRTPSGAFAGQLFANTVTADILVRDGNDRVLNSAWGGWSWITITVWVWAPVGSGTNPWDMYIDYNTANIYVWNGTSWVVNNATGGSWSWIIYSLANGTVVASTTGDRWLASTGTWADKTYETSQEIDPLTGDTINMNFWPWGTVVFDDTDINFENWTTLNYDSTVVSNHNGDTVNYDWSTINSENTEYNHTGDTINYDATTTVEWGVFNNPTFTWTITWVVNSVTDKTISLIASETISIWDHVSSWVNNFWHNIDNWSVTTFSIVAWWSAPMSFGQTFNIAEDWIITTLWSRFIYTDIWTLHWASYSITANIYNITWVYWSTAVNTWASLWSSNTLTWSVSPWWTITINALFDFWKVSLNAWNYAVVMTWTITAWWTLTNASFNVRWDLLNWYSWNFINWWVADWTKDMYFYVNYISNSYVQKADADDSYRLIYKWQAVTWWNQWDIITVKTRWVLNQLWIVQWDILYVSNTAWQISTTPWTNRIVVWNWIDNWVLELRQNTDLNNTEIDTSGIISWSSFVTWYNTTHFLSWWWLIKYNINSWTWSDKTIVVEISKDLTNWQAINLDKEPFTSAVSWWTHRIMVEPNMFTRIWYYVSSWTWTANITSSIIPF